MSGNPSTLKSPYNRSFLTVQPSPNYLFIVVVKNVATMFLTDFEWFRLKIMFLWILILEGCLERSIPDSKES